MISFPILKILLVVLVVGLIALAVAVAYLSGKIKSRSYEDSDDPPRYAGQAAHSVSSEAPVSALRPSAAEQSLQPGIPGEIVAAIAAAVCCMEPGTVVTSVRRAPQNGVSAWKMAGLLESTRPFF